MTTIELKKILIQQIAGINDKSFLTAIKTIIETKSKSTIYKTTPEQRQRISEGRLETSNGIFFSNDEVENEIDKWLGEK